MRTFLIVGFITICLSFGLSQVSYAVCVQNGNTPGGGNIINCPAPVQNGPLNIGTVPNTTNLADELNLPAGGGIDTPGVTAVDMEDGDDIVNVNGGSVMGISAIVLGDGNHTVTMNGGTLIGTTGQAIDANQNSTNIISINGGLLDGENQAIQTGAGGDDITVNGGTLTADDIQVIDTSGGNDRVTINAGSLENSGFGDNNEIIDTSSGNDVVALNGGTYMLSSGFDSVDLGSNNDLLTFGANVNLDGFVDCGTGFDTLVFAMEVPEDLVLLISSEIIGSNPAGDSIVINDITYEWEDCELLLAQLVAGPNPVRPIPTLSQWGLIALAGIMGIVGVLFVRRKVAD